MLPTSEKYACSQLSQLSWDKVSQSAGVIQLCIWACEKAIYCISLPFYHFFLSVLLSLPVENEYGLITFALLRYPKYNFCSLFQYL